MTETIQLLREQLRRLQLNDNWRGIYEKFQPIEKLHQNDLIWNNHQVLNAIAFACAKLSETSSIPREIFRDEETKSNFLKQQAKFRKHTERIRKRCIELDPSNAGYHSNLAYTYYQNINELTAPQGRRDGNLKKEIDNFIIAIDETLALDPRRVTDLYRKGRILADILPNKILWTNSYDGRDDFSERLRTANKKRDEGIKILLRAKNEWEKLIPNNPDEEFRQKRYRKDYIRSLYKLSGVYYDKVSEDWDESVFTLNLRDDISSDHQVIINSSDKKNITQSIQMIKVCCSADCPPRISQEIRQNQQNIEKIAAYNGEYEGVDKLYSIGKFFFAQYWILSGYGLKETADALEARETAERYLQAALRCEWSPEKAKQDKKFIVERIARVFISKGEYEQAISIIAENTENLDLKNADPYLLHTCAIALLKSGKITQTQKSLDSAVNSKRNTQSWLTYFLKGCAYLEAGEIELAQEQFELSHQAAERVGKKTVDSLLIAKAFVEYKSNNILEAVKLLEEARKLNPKRVSISERIRKWRQSEA